MNAALKLLREAAVAGPAGRRDVFRVDTRIGVGVWELAVRRMTACARGRDDKPGFQQTLSMNALCVSFDNLPLLPCITHGGLLPLAVTARAEIGNLCGEGIGLGITLTASAVCSVAFEARRRVGVFLGAELAMRALPMLLDDFGVARGAVDILGQGLAWPQVRGAYASVALAARFL